MFKLKYEITGLAEENEFRVQIQSPQISLTAISGKENILSLGS